MWHFGFQQNRKYSRFKGEERENLMGFPYVTKYKYLGINWNKNLSFSPHITYLKEKLTKFKKMATILRIQKAPSNKIAYFQNIFTNSVLDYGSFLINM